MDTLLKCPRCGSFVQPTWPSCKICGYDPEGGSPGESLVRVKPKPERVQFTQILGALATLAVLVGLTYGAWRLGVWAWDQHNGTSYHQEFVAIPH